MIKNKLADILKFITVLTLFLIITIPSYYYLNPSKTQIKINEIKKESNSSECTKYIQECYRTNFVRIVNDSRLVDIIKIKNFISFLHDKDLKNAVTTEQQAIANLLYLENLVIYLNHSRDIKIDRNTIDFFDIFFISKIRKDLKELVIGIKKESTQLDLRSLPRHLVYRKDMALRSIASFDTKD